MRNAIATLILGVAAACMMPAPMAQTSDGPIVRAGVTRAISSHTYVIDDNSVPGVPNVGFVVGNKAVLVIDTGMGVRNGETVLAEAQKLAKGKALYLVTTHVHPEHDLGAQAFPANATLVRSTAQVGEIAEEGMKTADAFRARSEINKALLDGAQFRAANVTFEKSYNLDLGGMNAHLVALGPAHTQGDTVIWVEKDRILFAGDLAMKAPPAFASSHSSLKQWMASLDVLAAFQPDVVVPSHGPVGDASYISGYRAYLAKIKARTAELKGAGKNLEETTTIIETDLKAEVANTSRVAGAVRSAYSEAP